MASLAPLVYRLSDPSLTIYHRAAMGGLAATIRAWCQYGVPKPLHFEGSVSDGGGALVSEDGVRVDVHMDASTITLDWSEGVTDRHALALLLAASFQRSDEGMIYLPGQGFGTDREDVLLAVHNGLAQTFLQHNKKRPGKGVGSVALKVGDADQADVFTFKRVDHYSHQVAQGTRLLGKGWDVEPGELPEVVALPQSVLPGAVGGARDLGTNPRDAFLLQYLMVACPVFLVRSRRREEKVQSGLVVPDVTDLTLFARRLHRLGAEPLHRFSNTYLGRVVGGAEEAALKFLIDLRAGETSQALGISNFLVVSMGKVPWDNNQQNRSGIARVSMGTDYDEIGVFEAAATHLGRAKVIKNKKGEAFAVPDSPVPELIAANLTAGEHWCAHFQDLVAKKQDFINMLFRREGLLAMRDAIQNPHDQLVIRRFQKAWEMTMGSLGERARREGIHFSRLVEVERERIRNDLLRCKTSDQLAGWLLNFMARASREGTPKLFSEDADDFRSFIFNPRNAGRLQNLLLFALVSYAPEKADDPTQAPATSDISNQ